MTFSLRLKRAMHDAHKSQDDLAGMLGISQVMVSKYLRGSKPKEEVVKRISELLGCDYVWLATGMQVKINEVNEALVEKLTKENINLTHELEKKVLEIHGLKNEISGLRELVATQKETIADLRRNRI